MQPSFLKHLPHSKCLYLFKSLQLNSANTKPHCVSHSPLSLSARLLFGSFSGYKKQHPLTQSSLTMPSCCGIACLAKRYSPGSGSQITKHENERFSPADFWKLPHCTYLILIQEGQTEAQVDFVLLLLFFIAGDIHHTHFHDSHQCTISVTWHPNLQN